MAGGPEALTAALNGATGVTDLVGGADEPRIHWDELPRLDGLDAVIVHPLPSLGPDYTMGGRVPTDQELYQIDCWSITRAGSLALRTAVEVAVDSLRAAPVQAFIERRHAGADVQTAPGEDRATTLFRASTDVRVWSGTAG